MYVKMTLVPHESKKANKIMDLLNKNETFYTKNLKIYIDYDSEEVSWISLHNQKNRLNYELNLHSIYTVEEQLNKEKDSILNWI